MAIIEPAPYLPFTERGSVVDGEFRWRLGVRPLDLDRWIEFGPDADGPDGWIAQKRNIHDAHEATVFAVLDDVGPESTEVAAALLDHVRRHRHRTVGRDGNAGRHEPGLEPRLELDPGLEVELDPGLHPLAAAAMLVPEDLVLMVEREGRLVFGGGSVCFPNRWDLRSKLGRSMSEVHAPVARLNEQLDDHIDRFFDRLRPDRSWWRLGWGILDVADGYTPTDGTAPLGRRDVDPDAMFLRVERETIRRFPRTNCILFTIRTYVTPLARALTDGHSRHHMAAAIEAMSPEVLDYKDIAHVADRLVEWIGRDPAHPAHPARPAHAAEAETATNEPT